MTSLPSVLSPADLPFAELQAARLDGEVAPLGAGFAVVDAPDGPAQRLRAALAGRSPRVIAELDTAVWVWGLRLDPPRPLELCVDYDARARAVFDDAVTIREVVIEPDEVAVLEGNRVTTPLRTLLDLSRTRDIDASVARALARLGGLDVEACRVALERRPTQPGKLRALERLEAFLSDG